MADGLKKQLPDLRVRISKALASERYSLVPLGSTAVAMANALDGLI
jgi:hypothetical protein